MSFMGRSVSSFGDTQPAVDLDSIKNHIAKNNVTKKSHGSMDILPQKAVVLQMSDLAKMDNAVSNALIKAIPRCDVNSIKMFELIVNAINPENPPVDNYIYMEKDLIYSFLDISSTSRQSNLKAKIKKIMQELIFDFSSLNEDERNNVNHLIKEKKAKIEPLLGNDLLMVISEVSWGNRKSYVRFQLTDRVMFFLTYLEKNYTRYEILPISKFESKYSVVLYRWLMMRYKEEKGKKNKYKESYRKSKIKLTVQDLRALTDTEDVYNRFDNFEARVLKTAQKDINEYSVIQFEYEKLKKGYTIDSIEFFVTDNPKNIPVKEEILTPRKTKEEREKETLASAFMALRSPYTEMLSENKKNQYLLLSDKEKDDIGLMADLNEKVYSLYDQIVDKWGLDTLKVHLDAIRGRRKGAQSNATSYEEFKVNNLVGWLTTCAENAMKDNFKKDYQYKRNKEKL